MVALYQFDEPDLQQCAIRYYQVGRWAERSNQVILDSTVKVWFRTVIARWIFPKFYEIGFNASNAPAGSSGVGVVCPKNIPRYGKKVIL